MKKKRPRIIREKKVNIIYKPSSIESRFETMIYEWVANGWKLIEKDELSSKFILDGNIMKMSYDGICEFDFGESDEDPERNIMDSFRNGTQDNFGY